MSEVKLNLVDAERVLHGTIHGSIADACVAALSAEPETIAELEAALTRYLKLRDSNSYFASFHATDSLEHPSASATNAGAICGYRLPLDHEPWDAGVVVIDLAARIVASESLSSQPAPEGEVFYHDGDASTDVVVLYRLPDDWLFVNSVDAYHWSRERRFRARMASRPVDARPILFGRRLLEFIVVAYFSLAAETRTALVSPTVLATAEADQDEALPEALAKEIRKIHASWLLTPREDLRGRSPRNVLLARRDFIDFDLHTRSLQWSLQNEGPPCLSEDSFAYRFAGFGTHEVVLYYDLVRHLIWSLVKLIPDESVVGSTVSNAAFEQLIARLDQIKTDWLESPQSDCDGRIPAIVINNERKRLPQALRPSDMIIDDDCPMCRMFGDETSPLGMGVGFWHLDGSHMDDEFAFSFCRTAEEWEAENRRREEFDREFNRKWEERQQRLARGETLEPDPFFDLEPVGAGWGWFDPLLFPDSAEPESTSQSAPVSVHDDPDESDAN